VLGASADGVNGIPDRELALHDLPVQLDDKRSAHERELVMVPKQRTALRRAQRECGAVPERKQGGLRPWELVGKEQQIEVMEAPVRELAVKQLSLHRPFPGEQGNAGGAKGIVDAKQLRRQPEVVRNDIEHYGKLDGTTFPVKTVWV
jgi:hypothetical protein